MKHKCNNCKINFKREANLINHKISCDIFYNNKSNILNDFNNGISYKKIGKKYNICRDTLSLYLKKSKIHKVNENFFENIDTSEKAWLVGLIAADGCIKRKNRLVLSQSGLLGLKLIKYVKNILCLRNKINQNKTNGKDAYSISIVSNKITNDLSKFNIVPNKSLIYEFPTNIPSIYQKDFIRGYIEGDGCLCIYKSGKYIQFTISMVGTKKFIEYTSRLLPIKPSVYSLKKSPVYLLSCGGKKGLVLCQWIFSTKNLYLSYKYDKYIQYKNYKI